MYSHPLEACLKFQANNHASLRRASFNAYSSIYQPAKRVRFFHTRRFVVTNFFSSTIFFNSLIGTIKRCNCFPVLMNGYCYVRRCCVTVKELPSTLMVDRVEQGRCGKDASSRYPRALLYGSATRIDPVY